MHCSSCVHLCRQFLFTLCHLKNCFTRSFNGCCLRWWLGSAVSETTALELPNSFFPRVSCGVLLEKCAGTRVFSLPQRISATECAPLFACLFLFFCYARVELLQASLLVLCSCSLLSMFPRLSIPRGLRAEVHFLFSTLFYSVFSVFALMTISLTKSYHQRQL